MSFVNLKSLRAELHNVIDAEAQSCLHGGPTEVEAVYLRVTQRAPDLIRRLQSGLADAELRSIIQRRLKNIIVDSGDASIDAAQMEFEGMEEFRGVDSTITYEDASGHCKYILYLDSQVSHREAAALLLKKQRDADAKRNRALVYANKFATTLVALYGDLPLRDLLLKWHADKDMAQQAGGN